MQNFVYLVGTEGQREVCVVDPAWDVDAIEAACAAQEKSLAGILLTHSHKDHINGVTELLRRHDLPVYAQRAEIDFSADLQGFGDALRRLGPGDPVPLGGVEARAVHTPGHTPGHISIVCVDDAGRHVDVISGATKTTLAYQISVANVLEEIKKREKK